MTPAQLLSQTLNENELKHLTRAVARQTFPQATGPVLAVYLVHVHTQALLEYLISRQGYLKLRCQHGVASEQDQQMAKRVDQLILQLREFVAENVIVTAQLA